MYKLLIIDDEPMICEGLKAYAKQWWEDAFDRIDTAGSGQEAWRRIEKEMPDVVITDIRMPHGTGIELLQRIREQEYEIKVIVLSGYNDFDYVRSMALLGIENYLLKPVNEEELLSTMEATLQKIQRERELQIKAQLNADLIRENIINRWIYGAIGEHELMERAEFLNMNLEAACYRPCCIKILGVEAGKNVELLQRVYDICREILAEQEDCYFSRNYSGDVIAAFCMEGVEDAVIKSAVILNRCMETIEEELGAKAYALLGNVVEDYWNVAQSFREALRNGVHLNKIMIDEEETKQADVNTSPFSLRLAQYVLEHYNEDLSLKSLAAHFKGNAAYIGQVFKRDINKSFTEYLKDVRIEKAKEFLVKGSASAKEIAQKVGFANTTYFCTVFKQETGLSPDKYRKTFCKK